VRPVGADGEREVDVRVLAATSRDLGALVQSGAFRKDLYYRLEEFVVTLPALRERPEDIPMVARAVLASLDPAARLTDQALRAVAAHPLPGNVRELRNLLKRAHALSGGKTITAESLGIGAGTRARAGAGGAAQVGGGSGSSFARAGAANAAQGGAALAVPDHVAKLSRDLWRLGTVVEPPARSRYEARAQLRAAFVHLRLQFPLATWPGELLGHHRRLFGDRWATTEGGRGLRDVMRVIGYDGRNEEVKGWLVGAVG
jgi:hypothetical protein